MEEDQDEDLEGFSVVEFYHTPSGLSHIILKGQLLDWKNPCEASWRLGRSLKCSLFVSQEEFLKVLWTQTMGLRALYWTLVSIPYSELQAQAPSFLSNFLFSKLSSFFHFELPSKRPSFWSFEEEVCLCARISEGTMWNCKKGCFFFLTGKKA